MNEGKRYWIPDLTPMVAHEHFPLEVYEKCVGGMTWGYAFLERVPAHIASNGTALPTMFVLKISLEGCPTEPVCVGIGTDNPFLRDHIPILGVAYPPANAAFLLYLFYDAKNCDALVGDLEERHKIIRKKFGARRANFWYWTQVIRSVSPIAWVWVKKIATKPAVAALTWAAAKRWLKDGSWLVAVAELYKKIRP